MPSPSMQLCFVLFHRDPTLWTTSGATRYGKASTSSPHIHLVWPSNFPPLLTFQLESRCEVSQPSNGFHSASSGVLVLLLNQLGTTPFLASRRRKPSTNSLTRVAATQRRTYETKPASWFRVKRQASQKTMPSLCIAAFWKPGCAFLNETKKPLPDSSDPRKIPSRPSTLLLTRKVHRPGAR